MEEMSPGQPALEESRGPEQESLSSTGASNAIGRVVGWDWKPSLLWVQGMGVYWGRNPSWEVCEKVSESGERDKPGEALIRDGDGFCTYQVAREEPTSA